MPRTFLVNNRIILTQEQKDFAIEEAFKLCRHYSNYWTIIAQKLTEVFDLSQPIPSKIVQNQVTSELVKFLMNNFTSSAIKKEDNPSRN
jgi:hypothetical protein